MTPLLRTALYIAWKEKPFNEFEDLIELNNENGAKITTAYSNNHGCKTFIHLLADQMRQELREEIGTRKSNFCSWLIDGSQAAKKKLTYEGELLYIRTAPGCIPKVELYDFITMKPYVSVNAANLYHATLRSLLSLFDPSYECNDDTSIELLKTEMQKYAVQIIGAGADGASVNFGRRETDC